jgi:hypothetical protein
MSAENKGYKFRFEYTQTVHFPGDEKQSPGSDNYRFVTYGNSAKETVADNKDLYDEWDKLMKKVERGPYHNKEELK